MPTISIDDNPISSVEGNFETVREEFNRLATDTLAERYDISPSFINEDGSFSETAKENLFEQISRDELLTAIGNLQQLRGTEEAQQVETNIATEVGSELGGVTLDDEEDIEDAKELQQERVEEQREQAREQSRSRRASTTPKLQEVDRDGNVVRELAPNFVSAFGGTLPFDTDSTQLQDGQTVTDQNGDQNIRLNMEMVLTGRQLFKLLDMRRSNNRLNVLSSTHSWKATFDEIKFDEIPDENGRVTADGQRIDDATFTVQLQSKESDENDTVLQPFESEE